MSPFEITGHITLDDIVFLIKSKPQLKLSEQAKKSIQVCREYLDKKMSSDDAVIYGINTGFGSLCNTKISHDQLEQLQQNLLLSHACGTGEYVPQEIVRLMLLLKIQSLSYGHSGVQLQTVELLVQFFN